jgi:hypothetical protein
MTAALPPAVETQPGPEDAMERDGGWVRPCGSDQLAILKVCQGVLDGASGEAGGGGDRLMGPAYRPVCVLGCVTIEVEVDEERGRASVVAHEVGQQAVEQVGVERYLYHQSL